MATSMGMYIAAVGLGIIIVVTVVGCLLTIVTIWTRPVLRKLINLPLASLSFADILFVIFGPAFWIQSYLHPQWEPPAALCWIQSYTTAVLAGVSLWHMLCIALQRYFNICTNSARLTSKCTFIIMLLLTWLVPIVSCLPLYAIEEVKIEPKMKRCAVAGSTYLWAKIPPVLAVYIGPYVLALITYVLIFNHVRKSRRRVEAHAAVRSNHLAVQLSREGGDSAGPSKLESVRVTHSSRNQCGSVWVGDKNSSSDNEESKSNDISQSGKSTGITLVSNTDQDGTSQQTQHARQNNAAEFQITKMIFTLFAVYNVCCMPLTIMVLIPSHVPTEAFIGGSVLMALNGALNPIVYGVMNKNIRQGYKHIWNNLLNLVTRV